VLQRVLFILPMTPTSLRFFAVFLSIARQMPNKCKGLPITCSAGNDRSSGTAKIILNIGARWGVAVQGHASNSCPSEGSQCPWYRGQGLSQVRSGRVLLLLCVHLNLEMFHLLLLVSKTWEVSYCLEAVLAFRAGGLVAGCAICCFPASCSSSRTTTFFTNAD